jgi:RNA 3'-terminal phosphate cyclase (ATP)
MLIPLNTVAVKPEYNLSLSSPGSVMLIFQAVYPYLLHVGSPVGSECIKLTLKGGTNGTDSPSYDYAAQVMAPNYARLGLPHLSMILHKRGWSVGRIELGSITFSINTLASGQAEAKEGSSERFLQSTKAKAGLVGNETHFPQINIMNHERGKITCIDITVLAPDKGFAGEMTSASTMRNFVERQTRRALRKALKTLKPSIFEASSVEDARIPIRLHTSEPTSTTSQLYLLLVAHTFTGFRIGHDTLLGKETSSKKGQKSQKSHGKGGQEKTDVNIVADLIDECVQGFVRDLADQTESDGSSQSNADSSRKSCLDRHMRDQIVVFEVLGKLHRNKAETGSQVQEDERYWSLHTQTAHWVCSKMLGSDH